MSAFACSMHAAAWLIICTKKTPPVQVISAPKEVLVILKCISKTVVFLYPTDTLRTTAASMLLIELFNPVLRILSSFSSWVNSYRSIKLPEIRAISNFVVYTSATNKSII